MYFIDIIKEGKLERTSPEHSSAKMHPRDHISIFSSY